MEIENKRDKVVSGNQNDLPFASLSRSASLKRTRLAGGHAGREDGVNSGELRGVCLAGSQ